MTAFIASPQDLAAALLTCADRRRAMSDKAEATRQDIKVLALLERLADEVRTTEPQALGLSGPGVGPLQADKTDGMLAQVGVLYWPSNAADLVHWLLRYANADDPRDPLDDTFAKRGDRIDRGKGTVAPRVSAGALAGRRRPLFDAASDFSAGVGIVAPLLALREIGRGIGQWRDQDVAARTEAVHAVIAPGKQGVSSRSPDFRTAVVVSFRPPGSTVTCTVPMQLHRTPIFSATAVDVVPRSSLCEAPLIRSEIGDPATTFLVALALLAAGLAALKCWDGLGRANALRVEGRRRPFRTRVPADGRLKAT